MLIGDVGLRVRELARQTCEYLDIEIQRVVMSHVHLLVSAPPNLSSSEIMRRIKGRLTIKLFQESPQLKKRYRGQNFRARGYFYFTAGE